MISINGKILVEKEALLALATRRRQWETVANGLRQRLDDEHVLLVRALHELAGARGAKDHANFADKWLKQAREPFRESWRHDGGRMKPR